VGKDSNDRTQNPARKAAERLVQAASQADGRGSRLWRLEWAQAFQRLADIGSPRSKDEDEKQN